MSHSSELEQLADWFDSCGIEGFSTKSIISIIRKWQPADCNCQEFYDDEMRATWTCPVHGKVDNYKGIVEIWSQ